MATTIKAKSEYMIGLDRLDGGLNLTDSNYVLKNNESPSMKNLLWRNGFLASRKGQRYIMSTALGTGYATYERLWHGYMFAHIGTRLYSIKISDGTYTSLSTGIPMTRGTFFMYDGCLYYKTKNAYKKIIATYNSGTQTWSFTVSNVTAYVPVIVINAAPGTGSGDIYQPENRYSPRKTVWFNAEAGVREYFLPVVPDDIITVVVDGVTMLGGWSFVPAHGSVLFDTAPAVTNPPTNNTVRITYTKTNTDAYNSIAECTYAISYGGTGELCVVMAGCESQPNAYFWSGNSNLYMDPGYFPMEQYQIAGETDNPIRGFGKQQSNLIIFQETATGKATLGTQEINGRNSIDMPYTPINAKIGCDKPWSIQLIRNNLVWANSNGVFALMETTEAFENYVKPISGKIDGTPPGGSAATFRRGLLYDLYHEEMDHVCSCDDEHRYYVMANGHTWVWDYELSSLDNPAWFMLDATEGIALTYDTNEIYQLSVSGRIIGQQEAFNDFGRAIERYYYTPTQYFENYDSLKNVNSVIITLAADYATDTKLTYVTDYETRDDLTNLVVSNTPGLSVRPVTTVRPGVFRRRPMCRRIMHFALRLYNKNLNEDLAIVSADIFYSVQGKLR